MFKNTVFFREFIQHRRGINRIKAYIRKNMTEKRIAGRLLAKETNINIYKLMYWLFCPVSGLGVVEGLAICKYLQIDIDELMAYSLGGRDGRYILITPKPYLPCKVEGFRRAVTPKGVFQYYYNMNTLG